MITYEEQRGHKDSRGVRHWNTNVFLDNKLVGEIIGVADGYTYKPKGKRTHGDVFATLAEVKRSLEG